MCLPQVCLIWSNLIGCQRQQNLNDVHCVQCLPFNLLNSPTAQYMSLSKIGQKRCRGEMHEEGLMELTEN